MGRLTVSAGRGLLVAGWLGGSVALPTAVWAQCSSSGSPSPATPATFTASNQQRPVAATSIGIEGCAGAGGSVDKSGHPGDLGQPGGGVTVSLTAGDITQGNPTFAVTAASIGGNGGAGGPSGTDLFGKLRGGTGGTGGGAGTVTLNFGGTVEGTVPVGFAVQSSGGAGGAGGNSPGGIGGTQGGTGGVGGAGGSATATVSGTVAAVDLGLAVGADGGGGGDGGPGGGGFGAANGGGGGAGASGGSAAAVISGTFVAGDSAAVATAEGGDGGDGGSGGFTAATTGGDGGVGGAGGTASVTGGGSATSLQGIALVAQANGGDGGDGATAVAFGSAKGGSGGTGGTGGTASATVASGAGIVSQSGTDQGDAALLVQANGGKGGKGGTAGAIVGNAGGGGYGGAGGSASATISGGLSTSGPFVHGALVQSVGGVGGDGNSASGIFASGGAGLAGGDGGAVSLAGSGGTVTVSGPGSVALLGQSVGGGGGSGGNVLSVSVGVGAGIAIGGNGGLGGDGGAVSMNLTSGVYTSTNTKGGAGVLVQSIGGAGGAGGNATADGTGILELAIGGDAQGGGSGGNLDIQNGALVTTFGDHAVGIEAQSIGGGGGKGGSGASFSLNILPISVSVGGRGGGGGPAGAASITNNQQVTTYGPDAPGLRTQSIGGGGGHGGAAVATTLALSPDPEIPAIDLSVSVGGKGGAGNTGGTVTIDNAGFAATAGHGSAALMAQSIGGGGGAGGDSSAGGTAMGAGELNLSIDVAVGGSGGTGGTGGQANLSNSGLLFTLGESSIGILGQSVGGGGGAGSGGDASAKSVAGETLSFGASIAVGGSGGIGGTADRVTIANQGGIATAGDGADGILGQSIGGGGGLAGGGVGKANGGNLAIAVGVGGSGGSGGDGAEVDVSNFGGILTLGTDAAGLTAQSIGGGGGRGGKGGATAGGAAANTPGTMASALSKGLGIGQDAVNLGNGVYQVGDGQLGDVTGIEQLGDVVGDEPESNDGEDGEATSVKLGVSVGGGGGAGGLGGAIQIEHGGAIATEGALSDGIFAQSVGGGGGIGGAASSSTSGEATASGALALGGTGGAGGDGSNVSVRLDSGSTIATAGVSAFGVVLHSIGGGGGKGSIAGARNGALQSLAIGIGGDSGVSGNGGQANVILNGAVSTTGKHAVGVLLQSIGGGGGIAKALATDQTGTQSDNADADDYNVDLTFNGSGSGGGSGQLVQVQSELGSVTTSGRNAHGILAQSIGGGGGLAVGGQATGNGFFLGGSGGAGGSGGPVLISTLGTSVATTGDGAMGILAQSIGGGGGIGGDIASSTTRIGFAGSNGGAGDGGAVELDLEQTTISTTGANASAILAQSIGGGGGLVTTSAGAQRGTAGGNGTGAGVTVNLTSGTAVSASGANSSGIHAQSDGTSSGVLAISLDATSTVTGGSGNGAAIWLEGGTANTISNAGKVISAANGTEGWAIYSNTAASNLTITNTGTITGSVFGTGARLINGGLLESGRRIALGAGGKVVNRGTLSVGGVGRIARSDLTGELVHTGHLLVDLDSDRGKADLLHVTEVADLRGDLEIHPITLAKGSLPVLTSDAAITLDPGFAARSTLIFSQTASLSGTVLDVATDADFRGDERTAEGTRRNLARHLQSVWDSGTEGFGSGFASLAGVGSGDYGAALDAISGRTANAVSAARYEASQRFARTVFSCPAFVDGGTLLEEQNCAWGRVVGSRIENNATPGYDWRASTAMIGGQRRINEDWFAGGALGYETSDQSGDDGTDVDGNAVLAVFTLKRQTGPLLLAGAVDFGYGWLDSTRNIAVGDTRETATASTNALNAGLHLRGSWEVPREGWYLQPALELDASYVKVDGYTESGAGDLDLTVGSSDDLVLAATPLLKVGGRTNLEGGTVLNLYASGGVSFLSQDSWTSSVRFAGVPVSAGSFETGIDAANVVGRLSAGVDIATAGRLTISLLYDASWAEEETSQSGLARLSWSF